MVRLTRRNYHIPYGSSVETRKACPGSHWDLTAPLDYEHSGWENCRAAELSVRRKSRLVCAGWRESAECHQRSGSIPPVEQVCDSELVAVVDAVALLTSHAMLWASPLVLGAGTRVLAAIVETGPRRPCRCRVLRLVTFGRVVEWLVEWSAMPAPHDVSSGGW